MNPSEELADRIKRMAAVVTIEDLVSVLLPEELEEIESYLGEAMPDGAEY